VDTGDTIRLQLVVHYDGSDFHGWQFQPELRTVQGVLEAALSRLADSPRTVVGSGRTDTGVHATGQVACVDLPSRWLARNLRRSLNAVLPRDVWIERVEHVRPDFHPRYEAVRRTYTYRVGTAPEAASPFHGPWCWPVEHALDPSLLHSAAGLVVGTHSFRSLAKTGQPERGYVCTVHQASWGEWEWGMAFTITANRYLHHMVRYMVGTMVDVARGRRPLLDLTALLEEVEGKETSPPAPPQGLFLTHVEYPVDILPDPVRHPESRSSAKA